MGNRFRRVLKLTAEGFFANEVSKRAAGLTYYLIFAIFPFLIFVGSLLGFLHLPMISLEGEAAGLLPEDVVTFLNLTIAHMTETSNGAWLTFGLTFTLWFPLRAVKNMTDEISRIYGVEKPGRHTKRIIALALVFTVMVPALVLLMIVGEGVLNMVSMFIPLRETSIQLWTKLRFLPMAAGLFALISAIYYFSPNHPPAWRHILPGALFSVSAWILYSVAFSFYVDNMGRYSLVYGSVGAIIVFLIWMNWSLTSLLMGAVFNQALRESEGK